MLLKVLPAVESESGDEKILFDLVSHCHLDVGGCDIESEIKVLFGGINSQRDDRERSCLKVLPWSPGRKPRRVDGFCLSLYWEAFFN